MMHILPKASGFALHAKTTCFWTQKIAFLKYLLSILQRSAYPSEVTDGVFHWQIFFAT